MEIKDFIEKAKKGGWCPITPYVVEAMTGHGDPITSILLDPLAWEAVGEVEQWDLNFTNKWKKKAMGMMQFLLDEEGTIEQYLETL